MNDIRTLEGEDHEWEVSEMKSLISLLLKSLDCPICLDLLDDPVCTTCHHVFCRKCIKTVLRSRFKAPCPLCVAPITKRSLREKPKFREILQAVKDITSAFKEDCGHDVSPPKRMLVKSSSPEGRSSMLAFQLAHPSPLKPHLHKISESTSSGITKKTSNKGRATVLMDEDAKLVPRKPYVNSTNTNIHSGFPVLKRQKETAELKKSVEQENEEYYDRCSNEHQILTNSTLVKASETSKQIELFPIWADEHHDITLPKINSENTNQTSKPMERVKHEATIICTSAQPEGTKGITELSILKQDNYVDNSKEFITQNIPKACNVEHTAKFMKSVDDLGSNPDSKAVVPNHSEHNILDESANSKPPTLTAINLEENEMKYNPLVNKRIFKSKNNENFEPANVEPVIVHGDYVDPYQFIASQRTPRKPKKRGRKRKAPETNQPVQNKLKTVLQTEKFKKKLENEQPLKEIKGNWNLPTDSMDDFQNSSTSKELYNSRNRDVGNDDDIFLFMTPAVNTQAYCSADGDTNGKYLQSPKPKPSTKRKKACSSSGKRRKDPKLELNEDYLRGVAAELALCESHELTIVEKTEKHSPNTGSYVAETKTDCGKGKNEVSSFGQKSIPVSEENRPKIQIQNTSTSNLLLHDSAHDSDSSDTEPLPYINRDNNFYAIDGKLGISSLSSDKHTNSKIFHMKSEKTDYSFAKSGTVDIGNPQTVQKTNSPNDKKIKFEINHNNSLNERQNNSVDNEDDSLDATQPIDVELLRKITHANSTSSQFGSCSASEVKCARATENVHCKKENTSSEFSVLKENQVRLLSAETALNEIKDRQSFNIDCSVEESNEQEITSSHCSERLRINLEPAESSRNETQMNPSSNDNLVDQTVSATYATVNSFHKESSSRNNRNLESPNNSEIAEPDRLSPKNTIMPCSSSGSNNKQSNILASESNITADLNKPTTGFKNSPEKIQINLQPAESPRNELQMNKTFTNDCTLDITTSATYEIVNCVNKESTSKNSTNLECPSDSEIAEPDRLSQKNSVMSCSSSDINKCSNYEQTNNPASESNVITDFNKPTTGFKETPASLKRINEEYNNSVQNGSTSKYPISNLEPYEKSETAKKLSRHDNECNTVYEKESKNPENLEHSMMNNDICQGSKESEYLLVSSSQNEIGLAEQISISLDGQITGKCKPQVVARLKLLLNDTNVSSEANISTTLSNVGCPSCSANLNISIKDIKLVLSSKDDADLNKEIYLTLKNSGLERIENNLCSENALGAVVRTGNTITNNNNNTESDAMQFAVSEDARIDHLPKTCVGNKNNLCSENALGAVVSTSNTIANNNNSTESDAMQFAVLEDARLDHVSKTCVVNKNCIENQEIISEKLPEIPNTIIISSDSNSEPDKNRELTSKKCSGTISTKTQKEDEKAPESQWDSFPSNVSSFCSQKPQIDNKVDDKRLPDSLVNFSCPFDSDIFNSPCSQPKSDQPERCEQASTKPCLSKTYNKPSSDISQLEMGEVGSTKENHLVDCHDNKYQLEDKSWQIKNEIIGKEDIVSDVISDQERKKLPVNDDYNEKAFLEGSDITADSPGKKSECSLEENLWSSRENDRFSYCEDVSNVNNYDEDIFASLSSSPGFDMNEPLRKSPDLSVLETPKKLMTELGTKVVPYLSPDYTALDTNMSNFLKDSDDFSDITENDIAVTFKKIAEKENKKRQALELSRTSAPRSNSSDTTVKPVMVNKKKTIYSSSSGSNACRKVSPVVTTGLEGSQNMLSVKQKAFRRIRTFSDSSSEPDNLTPMQDVVLPPANKSPIKDYVELSTDDEIENLRPSQAMKKVFDNIQADLNLKTTCVEVGNSQDNDEALRSSPLSRVDDYETVSYTDIDFHSALSVFSTETGEISSKEKDKLVSEIENLKRQIDVLKQRRISASIQDDFPIGNMETEVENEDAIPPTPEAPSNKYNNKSLVLPYR